MQTGSDREALLEIVDRLRSEFADPEADGPSEDRLTPRAKEGAGDSLDRADKELVGRLREALSCVARTLNSDANETRTQASQIALDGSEFVVRHALAAGETQRVLKLMPSFVFLVALSVTDQERALELSRLASAMVEERLP